MSRDETIEFRVDADEKAEIRAAADRAGLTVGSWLRLVALREARQSKEEAAR